MVRDLNGALESTAQYVKVPRPFVDNTERTADVARDLDAAAQGARDSLLEMVGRGAATAAGARIRSHRWPATGKGTHRRGGERDTTVGQPSDADEIAAIGKAMADRVDTVVNAMPRRSISGI